MIHRYSSSSGFQINWLDSPGDRPNDIRARRFIGHMKGSSPEDAKRRPVFRVEYYCNQECLHDSDGSHEALDANSEQHDDSEDQGQGKTEDEDETDLDAGGEDEPDDPEALKKKKKKDSRFRYGKAECKVKLLVRDITLLCSFVTNIRIHLDRQVEIYSHQPSHACIYQRHTHNRTIPERLGMSQSLRRIIMEKFYHGNYTTSHVLRDREFRNPSDLFKIALANFSISVASILISPSASNPNCKASPKSDPSRAASLPFSQTLACQSPAHWRKKL